MSWWDRAECRGEPSETFFSTSGDNTYREARAICAQCPVRSECLDEALEMESARSRFGFQGGMSPNERDVEYGRRKAAGTLARRVFKTAQCGTPSGHNRHRTRGETPCRACQVAQTIAVAAREGRAAYASPPRSMYPSINLIASHRDLYADSSQD